MENKKTGSRIGKEEKISVIIPLYGSFDTKRTEMSIDSLKRQRGVDLEIIVAEQSNAPKLSKIEGIKHVRVPKQNNGLIPGKIRNRAIRESSGELIYNNDGDIIFPNSSFLSDSIKIMKEKKCEALYRPPHEETPIRMFP